MKMGPCIALLIAALWLSGCASTDSDQPKSQVYGQISTGIESGKVSHY